MRPADQPHVRVRAAAPGDVPLIEEWIRAWSDRERLLPLAGGALRAALPDFRILSPADGSPDVFAFGALRRYTPRLAEIRSVVVADGLQGRGLGRILISALLEEARREGLGRVFVLTRTPAVFERLGFGRVLRDSLPQKVFVDCSVCFRRERCDEQALVKDLP